MIIAIVACTGGILCAPFHAAAYLATPDGSPPILPWAEPFRALVGGALSFGTPEEVYLAYGKLAWVGVAGLLLGAVVLHARQASASGKLERVGFRLLAGGLVLALAGSLVEYYTPFLEQGFMFLSAPGILLTFGGYVTFGLGTRRAGVVPPAAAWTFILAPLVVIAMVALFGHIPFGLAPLQVATIGALLRTRDA